MLDPITTSYLAGVATTLTANILGALGRRTRQAIQDTPRQKALERCYQAALAAMLLEDDPHSTTRRALLEAFVAA